MGLCVPPGCAPVPQNCAPARDILKIIGFDDDKIAFPRETFGFFEDLSSKNVQKSRSRTGEPQNCIVSSSQNYPKNTLPRGADEFNQKLHSRPEHPDKIIDCSFKIAFPCGACSEFHRLFIENRSILKMLKKIALACGASSKFGRFFITCV